MQSSSVRRKLLFASLYFSEGAPIGFLWWALPTRLTAVGVPLGEVTALTALLVLPWMFKFLWAPLVDALQFPRWTLRHWITICQAGMVLTLLPLLTLDWKEDFAWLKLCLLLHAVFAATQDVSIDALCISLTTTEERGAYNGWMQAGMLAGRSLLGGGALIMIAHFGSDNVVGLLMLATGFSAMLLWLLPEGKPRPAAASTVRQAFGSLVASLRIVFISRLTWLALLFALTAGAAFEALGGVQGPFLHRAGMSEEQIGWILAAPFVAAMTAGAVAGGYLADRLGHRRFVATAAIGFIATVAAAAGLIAAGPQGLPILVALICTNGLWVGMFTAASYALLMDLSNPEVAGTQFSTYMGATNGCESWSVWAIGRMQPALGLSGGLWVLCVVSLASLATLVGLRRKGTTDGR